MFSNIFFFIFFHSMVMYCNGVEDEGEYLEQEVKQAIEKYSDAFHEFHNYLYIHVISFRMFEIGVSAIHGNGDRLFDYFISIFTQHLNVNVFQMLFHFNQGRVKRAPDRNIKRLLTVDDHKLLIELSEEKWSARRSLNEVEKKYFAQTEQNENKNQYKLSLNLRDANDKVSAQISNKEFLDEYDKSRQKLNDELDDLANMIEKAQYQRFELFKILPSKERINRLVLAMDKERETCQNRFDSFHFNGVRQLD
ncbi:hypothetical protein KSF78_0004591 [Schistosoma japonicum]|nr:hypothetical protein KSF78_0004591 [Schistosoma japonicum]